MNDTELLEKAAGAAGYAILIPIDKSLSIVKRDECGAHRRWNPLECNRDAFKLMVDLGISVAHYPLYSFPKHSVWVRCRTISLDDDGENSYTGPELIVSYDGDPEKTTRRAIVRAAAELFKE